jgi:CDP-diacylglycerol--glycerol-3-phosphate 3-phosphatidyltransferase
VKNLKEKSKLIFLPIAVRLRNVQPNCLTLIGFIIACISGLMYYKSYIKIAGFIFLLSGVFDILDGMVAKMYNKKTKFGALLDSFLDRGSDFFVMLGIIGYYLQKKMVVEGIIVLFLLFGSFMTSYVRARSEGLGYEMKKGIASREVRVILIGISSFLGWKWFSKIIFLLAGITNFTAISRLYWGWKIMKND